MSGLTVRGSFDTLSAAPVAMRRGLRPGLRSYFLGGLFGDPFGPGLWAARPLLLAPGHWKILKPTHPTRPASLMRTHPG